jgi:arsenical pump membrane protein
MAGASALVLLGLLPVLDAVSGIRKGIDVYLFLTGMMLIAELAQSEGLFDYLAALAVENARGSPQRRSCWSTRSEFWSPSCCQTMRPRSC